MNPFSQRCLSKHREISNLTQCQELQFLSLTVLGHKKPQTRQSYSFTRKGNKPHSDRRNGSTNVYSEYSVVFTLEIYFNNLKRTLL